MRPGEKLSGRLERIYRENRQSLFTYALSITRCREMAEDAVQDAFCRLFRLDGAPRRLKPYVFRAVRNAALNQVRGRTSSAELSPESIFANGADPQAAAVASEFRERVEAALARLSEDEREVLVGRLYADLTFREIAAIREVPLATAATWYRRGLEKLRAYLRDA